MSTRATTTSRPRSGPRAGTEAGCQRCGAPWYAADDACPTPCAALPGLPENVSADTSVFPNPLPNVNYDYAIEDRLKVPKELPPGEYVLGWRWDAEMTSQVWSTCSTSRSE